MRQLLGLSLGACLLVGGLAGCNSVAVNGVGTDLYTSDLPKTSEIQDKYVAYICGQAGGATCEGSSGWDAFVLAGMNDIDSRCDAYLAWLDRKKRSAKPILSE